MTPDAALEAQIKLYRQMTGEQRLKTALDLKKLACHVAREGIRHQHPQADAAEVERLLRRRLILSGTGSSGRTFDQNQHYPAASHRDL